MILERQSRSEGGTTPPSDRLRCDVPSAADVQLVRWPEDADRRTDLARQGVPRVLLVPDGQSPPDLGIDEDWIWVPADEQDLWARMRRLAFLQARRAAPHLHGGVVLHYAGRSVVLEDVHVSLVEPLIEHFRALVLTEELEARVWPDGTPGPNAIYPRIHRLRSRLAKIGLVVHSVRGRGYILDCDDSDNQRVPPATTEEYQWPIS